MKANTTYLTFGKSDKRVKPMISIKVNIKTPLTESELAGIIVNYTRSDKNALNQIVKMQKTFIAFLELLETLFK